MSYRLNSARIASYGFRINKIASSRALSSRKLFKVEILKNLVLETSTSEAGSSLRSMTQSSGGAREPTFQPFTVCFNNDCFSIFPVFHFSFKPSLEEIHITINTSRIVPRVFLYQISNPCITRPWI